MSLIAYLGPRLASPFSLHSRSNQIRANKNASRSVELQRQQVAFDIRCLETKVWQYQRVREGKSDGNDRENNEK